MKKNDKGFTGVAALQYMDAAAPEGEAVQEEKTDVTDTQDALSALYGVDVPDELLAQTMHKAPSPRHEKRPRINMSFSQDNLEHINIMARLTGTSATAYVNWLIDADRKAKADMVARARSVFNDAEADKQNIYWRYCGESRQPEEKPHESGKAAEDKEEQ